MLTGLPPSDHGVVGNGWYYRDTQEIRFWQQANSLVQGEKLYDGIETATMFWWFNQSSSVKYSATPKPHYAATAPKFSTSSITPAAICSGNWDRFRSSRFGALEQACRARSGSPMQPRSCSANRNHS